MAQESNTAGSQVDKPAPGNTGTGTGRAPITPPVAPANEAAEKREAEDKKESEAIGSPSEELSDIEKAAITSPGSSRRAVPKRPKRF